MLDKIKNQARLLIERIRYCEMSGIEDNEYLSAKQILKAILSKYGWSESDLANSEKKAGLFAKVYKPSKVKQKTNPDWLKILANLVAGKFYVKCLSLDKLGFHLSATSEKALADTEEKLEYLTNRAFAAYNTHFFKPEKPSYLLGFAFGYEAYLRQELERSLERVKAEAEGQQHTEQNGDTESHDDVTTLAVIDGMFLRLNKMHEKLQDDGTVTPETVDTEIKNKGSFLIGYHDGMIAELKLFK